jgi:hypothetical protein
MKKIIAFLFSLGVVAASAPQVANRLRMVTTGLRAFCLRQDRPLSLQGPWFRLHRRCSRRSLEVLLLSLPMARILQS